MNKASLIDQMSTMTKMSKADCKRCLESFMEIVYKNLKKGKRITITNFGTYMVMSRKKRVGVNPSTGRKMEIPSKKVVKFRPGKKLREMSK